MNYSLCYLLIDNIDYYLFKTNNVIGPSMQRNIPKGHKAIPKNDLNNLLARISNNEKDMINAYTSIDQYLLIQN
jgi:hypothetical protein